MAENCKLFIYFFPHCLHQFFFFTSLHQTLFFIAYGLFVFLFSNVVKFVRNTGDIVTAFDDIAAQKPIGY